MLAQPERHFALPPEPRGPWGAWLVAIALQVVFVMLLVSEPQLDRPPDAFRLLLPTEIASPGRETTMRYQRTTTAKATPGTAATSSPPRAASPGAPRVVSPNVPAGEPSSMGLVIAPTLDTSSAAPATSPFRQRFGNGLLWVGPLPVTPGEVAQQIAGYSRKQIADSVITEIIQGYLDRMAEERAQQGPALPSWTTTLGGKKVGVDQKWIYLGPIKIPAALLALLPINAGGNPTAAEYNKRLSAMREDLFEAARRSANYEDFKKAVKGLREETQRKRDFEKNRRTAPDSGHG